MNRKKIEVAKLKKRIKKNLRLLVRRGRDQLLNYKKRVVVFFKQLKDETPKKIKKYAGLLRDTVSEDVAGVRLIKNSVAAAIYGFILAGIILATIRTSHWPSVNELIHPENGTEIIIGFSSMLLALLLPVAILIIQDSKDALLRRTVVKNIIQLNRLPIIVSLISLSLFVPAGQIIVYPNITLRTLGGAVSVTCFIYIVIMLLKSYRWLSDGSDASSGLSAPPSLDDPNPSYPNQFISYRFAQIVKFLNETTSHEAWTQLWSKWWPPAYDDVLHKAFFRRHKDILSNNKKGKYGLVTNELVAYRRNIGQRILEDYPYSIDYLGEFLVLYREMHVDTKLSPKDKDLYAANNAVSAIVSEIIEKNIENDKVYFLATAMEKYVSDRYGLDQEGKFIRDPVFTNFIRMLLDAIVKDSISHQELESSLKDYNNRWGVSFATIYENPQTISLTLIDTFFGWFKTTIKDINPKDSNFGVSSVLSFVFPTLDTITLGNLYWYLYITENTPDELEGLRKYMDTPRPFTLMSNTRAEFVPAGSEGDSLARFKKELDQQQEAAVQLFATLYANYLLRTRDLNNLISLSNQLADAASKERDAQYMRHLASLFESLKSYYQSQGSLPK